MASNLSDNKLALIGCGNLGKALLEGLIDGQVFAPENIKVSDSRESVIQEMTQLHNVQAARNNLDCLEKSDVALFAVKPHVLLNILPMIGEAGVPNNDKPLIISVAAGISTTQIEEAIQAHNPSAQPHVIRAMPNTPALVRQGVTALCTGRFATDDDMAVAKTLFEAVGKTVEVAESDMNAVTGLSGSGPAYIFLIVEALADAGVRVGLTRQVAQTLALQTLLGSAQLMQQTGKHPALLKDQVTSPGGTTIAGIQALEEGKLRATLMKAVEAATSRAHELGAKKNK